MEVELPVVPALPCFGAHGDAEAVADRVAVAVVGFGREEVVRVEDRGPLQLQQRGPT